MSNDAIKEMRKIAAAKRLTIIDAVTPLELVVTKDDIKQAIPKDPSCCAFAVASTRQYDIEAAYFFRTVAWLHIGKQLVRYKLTTSMSAEVVAFDRAKAMAPGTYTLSVIAPSHALGSVGRRARKKAARKKAQREAKRSRSRSSASSKRKGVKRVQHADIR